MELAESIPDVLLAGWICGGEWVYWLEYGRNGGDLPDASDAIGSYVVELADSLRASIDSAGIACSNVVLVEGRNTVRAVVDSCFSTADSVGLADAITSYFGSSRQGSWTVLGPEPRCFSTYDTNPHAVGRVEIRPDSTDSLVVVLLHRGPDGQLIQLIYPPLPADSSMILALTMADTLTAIQMEVDVDGNGSVDFLWYPGAAGIDGDAALLGPGKAVLSLASGPNPTAGVSTLSLRSTTNLGGVQVSIYDVAGREVRRISVGDLSSGVTQVVWDGRDGVGRPLASGIYRCVATYSGGRSAARAVVVLR